MVELGPARPAPVAAPPVGRLVAVHLCRAELTAERVAIGQLRRHQRPRPPRPVRPAPAATPRRCGCGPTRARSGRRRSRCGAPGPIGRPAPRSGRARHPRAAPVAGERREQLGAPCAVMALNATDPTANSSFHSGAPCSSRCTVASSSPLRSNHCCSSYGSRSRPPVGRSTRRHQVVPAGTVVAPRLPRVHELDQTGPAATASQRTGTSSPAAARSTSSSGTSMPRRTSSTTVSA